jgi:hypothetical protein
MSDILSYNIILTAWVENLHPDLSALGAQWKAIGSTAAVSAIDNVGVSSSAVGIYRLDGVKVASGTAGLFAPQLPLQAPIDIDEQGLAFVSYVWTGTNADGTASTTNALGSFNPYYGWSGYTDSGYLESSTYGAFAGNGYHLYAISSELTVSDGTPEPTTIGLTALGGAFLLFALRRKLQPTEISRPVPTRIS